MKFCELMQENTTQLLKTGELPRQNYKEKYSSSKYVTFFTLY